MQDEVTASSRLFPTLLSNKNQKGAVAPCKKMVIREKAGKKPVECTKIPG
jgi:hypothetical protein